MVQFAFINHPPALKCGYIITHCTRWCVRGMHCYVCDLRIKLMSLKVIPTKRQTSVIFPFPHHVGSGRREGRWVPRPSLDLLLHYKSKEGATNKEYH